MIKISSIKFYFITFILSILFYSVGNTKNEFPLDPAITHGKLENGFTYYIRENQTPKDINLKEPNQEIQDTQETKIPLKARWKLPERPKKRPNNPI